MTAKRPIQFVQGLLDNSVLQLHSSDSSLAAFGFRVGHPQIPDQPLPASGLDGR